VTQLIKIIKEDLFNMDMTIKIEAPALVDAIHSLAVAIAGSMELLLNNHKAVTIESIAVSESAPVIPVQAPVQQMPVQQSPIQQAPIQQAPVQQMPMQQAPVSPVPTTPQTYGMEQLAVAATQLVDAGRRSDLVGLLARFGVPALTALPKEHYGAFATELRSLGARI
jgi:hypothetical protein